MLDASVWSRHKRIGLAGFIGLVALTTALFALPNFVSEPAVRGAVTRSLIAATGIVPRIEGSAQLSVFPRPSIRLENVYLDHGSAPGFSAGSVVATIRLLPLLTGEVEISSLTFERPHLSIESRETGFVILGLPLRAPSGGRRDDLNPPELRIVNGHVELRGVNPDRAEVFTNVDASIAWIGSGVTATGTFNWQSVPTELTLSIGDIGQLNKGSNSGFRLRLESELLRAAFEGNLRVNNGVLAEGTLAMDAPSLRRVLALIQVAPLTGHGFGPLKMKAQAALTPAAFTLTGLSLDLDGNRSEGGLSLKREGGRTLLQATLASETADFTPYMRGIAIHSEDGRNWSRSPITLSLLNSFDLDLRLSSKKITLEKISASPVATSVTLRNGHLAVSVVDAGVYGGKLRGRAAIGPGANGQPLVKIEANLLDFDLERGLGEIANLRRVEGKGALDMNVEGSGAYVEAIVRNLSGRLSVNAVQGSLNGINVEQALRRLERRPLSGGQELAGGRTPFDRLGVKLAIQNGKAKVEEAQVENQLMRVRVTGETSIAQREFDLRGVASLVRPASSATFPPAFDMPFVVQGSWSAPHVLPDADALIQRSGAAAPLLEAVRKQQAERQKQIAPLLEPVWTNPDGSENAQKIPQSETR